MIETGYDKMRRTKGGGSRYEKTAVLDRSGLLAAAAAFCSFYPAKEWVFPAIALFGLSGLFCLLSARTRPAAIFSFSAAFMLLFCLLYGRLFAKPALDLSGRTLSLSGTVLETGRACFLLDGETRKAGNP